MRKAVVAALLSALVSCSDGEPGETAFPSRDWTGSYALEVVESSTDCQDAESPPPLGDIAMEIRQSVDNTAIVRIGPLVALGGRFDGDELDAFGTITQPISLPDSLAARAAPEDSLESITYEVQAKFEEGQTLRGRYVVGAPDLNALTGGGGAHRCRYVYEVRGLPQISEGDREEMDESGERL